MAGNIDFRHDFDIQLARMGDDGSDIRLGVEAPNRFCGVAKLRKHRLIGATHNAHGGQLRIGTNFEAPRLIIGQVPMEHVHLVPGENIDETKHVWCRSKLARYIEVASAPSVTRFIRDGARNWEAEQRRVSARAIMKLCECCQAVLTACIAAIGKHDLIFGECQLICFRCKRTAVLKTNSLTLFDRDQRKWLMGCRKQAAMKTEDRVHRLHVGKRAARCRVEHDGCFTGLQLRMLRPG